MTGRCVFGGTFNPPHLGHLAMARSALGQFALDRLYWVPAAQPPHKRLTGPATVADRVRMVRLAIEGEVGMELSLVDVERPGPSYAIDTLRLLMNQHPPSQWYWLIGEDSLGDLEGWYRADELVRLCEWLIAPRVDAMAGRDAVLLRLQERFDNRFHWLTNFDCEVSSTQVREHLEGGLPVEHLVGPRVADFIRGQGLYGQGQPA